MLKITQFLKINLSGCCLSFKIQIFKGKKAKLQAKNRLSQANVLMQGGELNEANTCWAVMHH